VQVEMKQVDGGTQYCGTVSLLEAVPYVSFKTDCFTFILEELVSHGNQVCLLGG